MRGKATRRIPTRISNQGVSGRRWEIEVRLFIGSTERRLRNNERIFGGIDAPLPALLDQVERR